MQKQQQALQVNCRVSVRLNILSVSLCAFEQHDCDVGTECRYLCDEALDTEALREALSLRVDGAEEVKKEMREDIAEDKRKLKVSQIHCTN